MQRKKYLEYEKPLDDRSEGFKKVQGITRGAVLFLALLALILTPLYTSMTWRGLGLAAIAAMGFLLFAALMLFLLDDGASD